MATIPKKDLVNRITNSTGAKQVLVRAVVQQFLDEITAELAQGNRLEFRDFGVFETRVSQPRTAQNPKTLERIEVPAKRKVVFKAGHRLRQQLNATDHAAALAL
jgi:nucleoid DNA-binding protein